MNVTTRFFIYAPFALFVALILGLSVYWWLLASAYSARLDALNGREVMPGVTMHFGSKRIAGYPFRVDAIFRNFALDVATPHGPFHWRSPDFALHALTYGRDETILEAAGVQSLDWRGLDGKKHHFSFVPGSLRASAIHEDGKLSRFDLVLNTLGSQKLMASTFQLHFRKSPTADGIDIFVSADDVRLAPAVRFAFGSRLAHLTLEGTFLPARPLDGLLAGRAPWPDAIDAWRVAEGTLHVDAFDIAAGPLDATGKGALAIDDGRRPCGALDMKLANFARFVAAARARGASNGITQALLDRAAAAGSSDTGLMGVVIGFKDGITYAGSDALGPISPLY